MSSCCMGILILTFDDHAKHTSQPQRFCVFFRKLLSAPSSKFNFLVKSKLVIFKLRRLE